MTTPFVKSLMRNTIEAGLDPAEMHWFDLSKAAPDGSIQTQKLLSEYRPPFQKCMVVWQGETKNHQLYEALMLVVGDDPKDGIVVSIWKGPVGQRVRKVPTIIYTVNEGKVMYGDADEKDPITQEEVHATLGFVCAWYESLSAGCEAYLAEAKPTFTNKRKIAQGKMPTYEWRTVVIEPAKPRSESKGGTHASPRLHDRRGHLRKLKNGKKVWVKACKVGKASLGTVFHDYEVRA